MLNCKIEVVNQQTMTQPPKASQTKHFLGHGYFVAKTALPMAVLAKIVPHWHKTERKTESNFPPG